MRLQVRLCLDSHPVPPPKIMLPLSLSLSPPPSLPPLHLRTYIQSAAISQLTELLLVLGDMGDLLSGGGLVVEAQLDPLVDELLGQLEPDDALPEAQHLRVVRQHTALHAVRVVRRHCPDPLDLVR